ncbi:uncharacterized protein LOC114727777 [Neltuma alba]|uniref:uncharacterized protein LOC114727777 n=1 Tax=Neltuma alba TaxID=207710 RepID=UPI0010A378E1|nr:uncharacterized protein LOC114727777 [Prosopis alba]
MGFYKLLQITCLIDTIIIIDVCLFSLPFLAESANTCDPRSVDEFVLDNVNEEIAYPHTGTLYNVSLPANFSGIQVSIVRIRTSTFWARGLNCSFVHFPPRIIPEPNEKRMAMIYSSFGNLSSQYFNVPNHTILPPVLGFMAHVSSNRTLIDPKKKKKMHLSILGDPIALRFPHQINPKGGKSYDRLICAKFDEKGFTEFSNMSGSYECEAPSQGHYALVVPMETKSNVVRGNRIWWKVGLGLGIVGMTVVGLCFVGIARLVKMRKIRRMEENSQRCEPFDTFWIGESKMPVASVTRTRPVLENDYAPAQCLVILEFPN